VIGSGMVCSELCIRVWAWLGLAWLTGVGQLAAPFPFLNHVEIWFIPTILGSLGVFIVAIDLGKMKRNSVA
jgi:hypothetical protein